MPRLIALLLLSALSTGCGTIAQATDRQGPAVFGGTRLDGLSLYRLAIGPEPTEPDPLGPAIRWLLVPVVLIDVPLSLALDVCLLPVSIPNEISEDGIAIEQDLPIIGAR